MNQGRAVWVISWSVLLEAVRRREVYVIVFLCCLLAGMVMTLDVFGLSGLGKFYREVSLKLMGTATAIAVLLLATRQLPREFECRTIYPLLARPVGRFTFLLGKGLGVCAAAVFCMALFGVIYILGIRMLGGELHLVLFLQHAYLQLLQALVLTSAAFLLSLVLHYDAALVVGFLLYAAAGILSSAALMLYSLTHVVGRLLIRLLTFALPQLVLFDLSEKVVHGELWAPLGGQTLALLTGYALLYTAIFTGGAYILFRRRAL